MQSQVHGFRQNPCVTSTHLSDKVLSLGHSAADIQNGGATLSNKKGVCKDTMVKFEKLGTPEKFQIQGTHVKEQVCVCSCLCMRTCS